MVIVVSDETSFSAMSVGVRNRIRYRFDNLLSRGTWAALVFLGAVTLAALILSALLLALADVTFAGSEGSSLLEDFWQSMLRAIDPGTMVADVGWGTRLLALLVTVFGILVAGTLIGLIASGVEQRVDEMQRGRSVVVESGHVLILGTSARLPVIVNQLTLARLPRYSWGCPERPSLDGFLMVRGVGVRVRPGDIRQHRTHPPVPLHQHPALSRT